MLPHLRSASSHSAAAPGTVTDSALLCGSSPPLMPAALMRSSVRPAGAQPLPSRQRTLPNRVS
jgi:hypothetical protein